MRGTLFVSGVFALIGSTGIAPASSFDITSIEFPGASLTTASGINNSGQVVGTGSSQGYLWSNSVFTPVNFPGALATNAYDINDAGDIVGLTVPTTHGMGRGFLESKGVFSIIAVPGSVADSATGINDAGQIVGNFEDTLNSAHGFLFSNGTFTQIDAPDSYYTSVFGINNAGDVVGFYVDRAFYRTHGFLYTKSGFTAITFPGSASTVTYGINDLGQIVGSADGEPFLYSNGTFARLDVPAGPTGINDVGQIVGNIYSGLRVHGYLATPTDVPEPSTVALLLGGLVGVAVLRTYRPRSIATIAFTNSAAMPSGISRSQPTFISVADEHARDFAVVVCQQIGPGADD